MFNQKSTVVRKILFLLLVFISSCATTTKMTNEAFHYALIGQNEMKIYARLGSPTRIISAPDGGKTMIYEFYAKGTPLTTYKSKITYSTKKNIVGERQGLTYNSGANTAANQPQYTIYQTHVSFLKVFLNNEGVCTRFEQNLTREEMEMFYDQFNRYIPPKN